MTKEIYVDGIGNISVQGSVVTLTMTRENLGSTSDVNNSNDVLHLTMTGQNLIKITNTLKRLAQRSQASSSGKDENSDSSKTQSMQNQKKDKTVN